MVDRRLHLAFVALSFLLCLHLWGSSCEAAPVGGFGGRLGFPPRPAAPPPLAPKTQTPASKGPQTAPVGTQPVLRNPQTRPKANPENRKAGIWDPSQVGPQPASQKGPQQGQRSGSGEVIYTKPEFAKGPKSGQKPGKTQNGDEKTHYATIDWDKTNKLAGQRPAGPQPAGNNGSPSGVNEKDGRLLSNKGQPLPKSKEEVDLKNPNSRWYKKDAKTGEWTVWRVTGGKEVYRKPQRGEPGSPYQDLSRSQAGPSNAGSSGFHERDGKLFTSKGEALPTSKDQVNTNDPNSRWFKKDPNTGAWHRWKLSDGREVYTSKPVTLSPGPPSPGTAGAGAFHEKDGKLFQNGQALPNSKDQVNANDPNSRWFKKDPSTGAWHRWKLSDGKEVYTSKPVTLGTDPAQ